MLIISRRKMISNTTKNVSRRHLCSVTAPRHPMKPTTMITDPVTMKRLAAESDGKEMERVANFPWVTANQTPTPRIPHPPSQKMRLKMNIVILMQSRHPRVILIFLSSLYGWRDRGELPKTLVDVWTPEIGCYSCSSVFLHRTMNYTVIPFQLQKL